MRAPHHVDVDPFGPPDALDLGDCGAEPVDFDRERLLGPHDDLIRADRSCRDHRAFEDAVRIVPQDRTVLEGARFTLGRIHDDRRPFGLRRVVAHRAPFASGREPGAPSAPQS